MNCSEVESFIRIFSHEMRNPLTAIKGYAQLLRVKQDDKAFVDKTSNIISEQVLRIENTFSSMYALFALKPALMDGVNIRQVLETVRGSLSPEKQGRVLIQGEADFRTDPALFAKAAGELVLGLLWNDNTSVSICIESMNDGNVAVDFSYKGIAFSELSEASFFMPWACCRYFESGLELFTCWYVADLLGSSVMLKNGKDGFRIRL